MTTVLSRRAFLGRSAVVGAGLAVAGVQGPMTAVTAGQRPIACWGDSLTEGVGSGNSLTLSYPARLGYYAQRTVYNGGRAGDRSGAIAARQAGVPARTTGRWVTIPSFGAVDVEFADEVFFKGTEPPVAGILRGVEGTMARIGDTGTAHRFSRTSPGSRVDVPVNSAFYPADGQAYRSADTIVWGGHNDDYVRDRPLPHPSRSIEDNLAAMIAYTEFPGNPSNYLVLSMITGRNNGIGTTYYDRAIVETNESLAATYGPDHFLNVHRYLVDQALADAGIRPTAQDLQDIDEDITPSSLREPSSAGHLNATGYDVLAKYIYDDYVSRRW